MKRILIIGSALIIVVVLGCEKKGLEAAFSASPTSGAPPLEVTFTDESEGDPSSWEWDFGDGNTSTGENPTHAYADTGSFDITLVVSNENGTDTATIPGYIVVTEDGAYKEQVVGDFIFKWRTTEEVIDVILSAPTTGWVAVGFDPTTAMQNANFMIGYVDGQDAMISDEFGDGTFTHKPDTILGGKDDVSNASGSEADGTTQISFTIPLDSGDENDRPLTPGQTYKIIFAYGPAGSDNFTAKHSVKNSRNIEL
ncbi:PKD domain-containing protein [candidate division WOR-3 bacterium]|nr:PKD domain-containing protein [candidate division WOR-3 bacterium]